MWKDSYPTGSNTSCYTLGSSYHSLQTRFAIDTSSSKSTALPTSLNTTSLAYHTISTRSRKLTSYRWMSPPDLTLKTSTSYLRFRRHGGLYLIQSPNGVVSGPSTSARIGPKISFSAQKVCSGGGSSTDTMKFRRRRMRMSITGSRRANADESGMLPREIESH